MESRNRKDLKGHFKLTILLALFLVAAYLNVEFIIPDNCAAALENTQEEFCAKALENTQVGFCAISFESTQLEIGECSDSQYFNNGGVHISLI